MTRANEVNKSQTSLAKNNEIDPSLDFDSVSLSISYKL